MSGVTDTLPLVPALTSVFAAAVAAAALSAMFFSWSSVAAWPLVAVPFQVVLVKPPIVPLLPLMVTGLPVAASPIVMLLAKPNCAPPALVVLVMLLSPNTLMVSPRAYLLLPVVPPKLMPLLTVVVKLVTLVLVACN